MGHRRTGSAERCVAELLAASPPAPPTAAATLLATPPAARAADPAAATRAERDVARARVAALERELREARDAAARDRGALHERVLALEFANARLAAAAGGGGGGDAVPRRDYDALAAQHTALKAAAERQEAALGAWEAWKRDAERITKDLALRLREEQRIRLKLEGLLLDEQQRWLALQRAAAAAAPPLAASAPAATPAAPPAAERRLFDEEAQVGQRAQSAPLTASPAAAGAPPVDPAVVRQQQLERVANAELSISVHHL